MSRNKLLLEVVQDMQALGNSLQVLAEALMAGEQSEEIIKEDDLPFDTSDMKASKPQVTLEEVRSVLARQSQAGFTAQVQSIIQRFDAKKLSDVQPQFYEEIMLLAEELSND